jgi:putrescine transport system ATP-binding protein
MAEQISATKKSKKQNHNKTLIEIQNVTKIFAGQDTPTLNNINLNIIQGDLFALVGPSGCGKTTLLRILAGFEKPTAGKILLDGQDITDLPPYERPLNMMFQSYALFPHMNVKENIEFGLKHLTISISEKEIKNRLDEALQMVGMEYFMFRKPDQLSGGQKQRVALARSLVRRPKVLLLDEPLGALDRKTRENTQVELIKIQSMLDLTFVMVTHDQEEAMAMSDAMAVINEGKVLQQGSAEEIYESPNSRFVAEFVDSINLFEGTVIKAQNKDGYTELEVKESKKLFYVKTSEDVQIGQIVWLGVRPEEVEIDIEPAPENENEVEGIIIDYGFLGQKIAYHVELSTTKTIHVTIPTSEKMKNPGFKTGKKVYVSWFYSDGVLLTR